MCYYKIQSYPQLVQQFLKFNVKVKTCITYFAMVNNGMFSILIFVKSGGKDGKFIPLSPKHNFQSHDMAKKKTQKKTNTTNSHDSMKNTTH